MILRLVIAVCLFSFLRSDATQTVSLLFELGTRSPVGYSQLYMAAKQNHPSALQHLSLLAIQHKQQYWINKSADEGAVDSLFYLANNTNKSHLKKQYLSQAAQLGHRESQFQLALLTDNSTTRIRLLENAARAGHKKAIVSLYYAFEQLGMVAEQNQWFPQAAELHPHIMQHYADYLWQHQGPEHSIEWLFKLTSGQESNVNIESKKLLAQIEGTDWQQSAEAISDSLQVQTECAMRIQFIAGTLPAIEQINQFNQKYQTDSRFNAFPICFNQPIWLEPEALDCSNVAHNRLTCSLQTVSELAESRDFTHAIVVADAGIANVHNGVMFLDREDDYRVFLHELAHFAGFVDEYEMDINIAENVCTPTQVPNLVIANGKPTIANTAFARYQSVDTKLELTQTRTCAQTTATAYKPVRQTTFMQHHDIGVIPKVYLQIWRDALTDRLGLTPIYVNFAQWFEANGNHEQAGYWWQKYNNYRS